MKMTKNDCLSGADLLGLNQPCPNMWHLTHAMPKSGVFMKSHAVHWKVRAQRGIRHRVA